LSPPHCSKENIPSIIFSLPDKGPTCHPLHLHFFLPPSSPSPPTVSHLVDLSLRPLLSKPCHPPRDLLSKLGTVRLLAAWKQGREERRLACSDSGEDAQPGRWIWCLRRWNCKPCSLGREARANWIWRGGKRASRGFCGGVLPVPALLCFLLACRARAAERK
jgi:hypothetical protein